jgi:hypothetical protein
MGCQEAAAEVESVQRSHGVAGSQQKRDQRGPEIAAGTGDEDRGH